MANELIHASQGTTLTQTEFEAVGLHVCNSQATGDLIYASSSTQLSRLGVGTNGDFLTLTAGIPAWTSNKATTLYIGDTANAKMTLGLTINQGANDDEILAFKSSDVDHGTTNLGETDTYAVFKKLSAADGGLYILALLDTGTAALRFQGMGVTDDTTKSTAGTAYVRIEAAKKDGVTTQDCGADANLVVIRNRNTTRFIFDTEGSAHADVEWTTFQDHNDLDLLETLEQEMITPIDYESLEEVIYNKDKPDKTIIYKEKNLSAKRISSRTLLGDSGVVDKDSWHIENGKTKAMININKLLMLQQGAFRQSHNRIKELEKKIKLLGG